MLGWEGQIPNDKLPLPYLKGLHFVVYDDEIEIAGITNYDQKILLEGSSIYRNGVGQTCISIKKERRLYSPEFIDEVIKLLRECGERLHHIRQEVKKLQQEWQGQVEVII